MPAGALITTFQKGLQYLELEANLAAEVPCRPPPGLSSPKQMFFSYLQSVRRLT